MAALAKAPIARIPLGALYVNNVKITKTKTKTTYQLINLICHPLIFNLDVRYGFKSNNISLLTFFLSRQFTKNEIYFTEFLNF